MTFNFTDLIIVAVLVAVASLLTYFSSKRALGRWAEASRRETERQLNGLTSTLKALEAQIAELRKAAATVQTTAAVQAAPVANPVLASVPAAPKPAVPAPPVEQVTPELLIVLAAAVTAFLGKKVRIRSAKMLQSPYEIVNPWSQQGRVIVQASHNLRSRG